LITNKTEDNINRLRCVTQSRSSGFGVYTFQMIVSWMLTMSSNVM